MRSGFLTNAKSSNNNNDDSSSSSLGPLRDPRIKGGLLASMAAATTTSGGGGFGRASLGRGSPMMGTTADRLGRVPDSWSLPTKPAAQTNPAPQPFVSPQPQQFASGQPQPLASAQPQPFTSAQPQPFASAQPQPFASGQPQTFASGQPQTFASAQPFTSTATVVTNDDESNFRNPETRKYISSPTKSAQIPIKPSLIQTSPSQPHIPALPSKTIEVPKAALYAEYGKKPRKTMISAEDYITWNDRGPPHALKFTSIFCCPLSGEVFPSAQWTDGKATCLVDDDGRVWYSKKTLAEHGAAARASDCVWYRQCLGTPVAPMRLGVEEPYLERESPWKDALPKDLPKEVVEAIEHKRALIRMRRQEQATVVTACSTYAQSYKEQRMPVTQSYKEQRMEIPVTHVDAQSTASVSTVTVSSSQQKQSSATVVTPENQLPVTHVPVDLQSTASVSTVTVSSSQQKRSAATVVTSSTSGDDVSKMQVDSHSLPDVVHDTRSTACVSAVTEPVKQMEYDEQFQD